LRLRFGIGSLRFTSTLFLMVCRANPPPRHLRSIPLSILRIASLHLSRSKIPHLRGKDEESQPCPLSSSSTAIPLTCMMRLHRFRPAGHFEKGEAHLLRKAMADSGIERREHPPAAADSKDDADAASAATAIVAREVASCGGEAPNEKGGVVCFLDLDMTTFWGNDLNDLGCALQACLLLHAQCFIRGSYPTRQSVCVCLVMSSCVMCSGCPRLALAFVQPSCNQLRMARSASWLTLPLCASSEFRSGCSAPSRTFSTFIGCSSTRRRLELCRP
jgi:hypothetical protein